MTARVPRWQFVSTAVLAALSVAAALFGLVDPTIYPAALRPGLFVQDLLVVALGVPALLIALRSAARGSLRGRVVWLGALAYATYLWASVALQVPFSRLFLAYVALFGLALFTFVGATLGTDPAAVRASVGDRLRVRVYAGLLWAIALGLAALWLAELVPATITGRPPPLVDELGPGALTSHVLDLAVVVPGLLVAGQWLRARRPWGYVLAGTGLVFGALLAPTISGATLVLLVDGTVTVPPAAVAFTVLPALVTTVLAVSYLRAMDGTGGDDGRGTSPDVDGSRTVDDDGRAGGRDGDRTGG